MFKINRVNLFLTGLLILTFVSSLNAQENEKLLPRFDYEVASFPGETFQNAETHVYIWVRNTFLQYITKDTVYSARYQINLGIYDRNGASVLTKDKTFNVTETSYAVTIDPKSQRVHRFELQLPPEEYLFKIRLLDLNSNRVRAQERKKTVRIFKPNELAVSDVLFVMKPDTGWINPQNVIPSFRIPIQEKFFVYAQVIRSNINSVLKVESTIAQQGGKEVFRFSQELVPKKNITKLFLQVNKESMIRGQNELYLKVTSEDQSKVIRKDLQIISGLESFEGLSVDNMIGPLLYVTDGDEWKKLNNASDTERDSVFQAFWDKRDPSPGSPDNELFNEFYKRVELANRNFGYSRKDGWKTDRGRVFIVFGPPDRVERGTPSRYTQGDYEVWYYDDLREKFVFFDEYGFGDFRLVSGNIRPAY